MSGHDDEKYRASFAAMHAGMAQAIRDHAGEMAASFEGGVLPPHVFVSVVASLGAQLAFEAVTLNLARPNDIEAAGQYTTRLLGAALGHVVSATMTANGITPFDDGPRPSILN